MASDLAARPGTSTGVNARYALGVLTAVSLVNFLDRQVIAILAEPIKRDLGLTDGQVGYTTGLSFALLYTTLGIPIAWLADRWNRPRIIAVAIAIWSAMTALCGLAQTFGQLFLARVGVGVGEAGSGPASHALLADHFPPEQRAGAFGIYGLGIPVGAFVAYAGGGWIVEHFSWRTAFVLAALPGIVIALVVAFTLKEPRARLATSTPTAIGPALRELAGKPAYWHLAAAATLVAFVGYGFASFYGAFFVRIHGMHYGELGLALGVMVGITGATGAWSGGAIADHFRRRDVAATLRAPAVVLIAATPLFIAGLLVADKWLALVLIAAPTFAATFYYGPTFASVQGLARPQTRAMAVAIFIFISSLVGMGAGPVFAGALSDAFAHVQMRAELGENFARICKAGGAVCRAAEASGVRRAILVLSLFNVWAAVHFLFAARTLKRDLV